MGDARIIDFNAALELRRREEASLASHFVNYHVHSEGSFLDGYSPVTSIAKRARELGQAAIGLSDHGECNQHYAFQKACIAEGVHPIFGMEGYYVDDIAQKKEVPNSHITLIAASQQGLANLWALSSVAYQRKYFHKKPLADLELLRHYRDGLWASDGCLLTELARAILVRGDEEEARQIYGRLLAVFGDRFFSELHTWQFMNPRTDDEIKFLDTKMSTAQANVLASEFNRAKLRLATELGIPQVVVNDAHHTRPEEWELKDMVWRINTGNKGDQLPEGQKADHLMGDQELYYWMGRHGIDAPHVERAIDMSWQIAQTCVAEIRPTLGMPSFTGNDHDDIEKFLDLVTEGFKRKVIDGGLDQERYLQRAESECQLIIDKGFAGYFCVDEDMVRAAKTGSWAQYVKGPHKEPIGVGPGRGSAGGSLVTWLLGITAIDPIRYGLLFERFLTPARKSPPDIDIDFPQSRLGDMVKYLGARWGHDHVCTIGTITRNAPKAMLRDLARAMGRQKVPQADVEAMSKIIDKATKLAASAMEARGEHAGDKGDEVRWDEILQEKGGDLAPWAHKHAELFRLLGLLVGIARQSGKHPSGVLMNKDPLLGRIPMRTRHHGTAKEVVTTQFDMLEVEELGGVKFDLLGLRNLDTLEVTKRLIRERHGVDIDWEALPEHDPAVWPQIHRGRTTGIFQLTAGTTRTAIELKPTSIEDLALLISIIRPGVKDAGLTERFLRRRAGVESTTYDHPLMELITADTHGVLVYQEQMMRASRDLAGFSADEADDLRKALGKKYMDKIKAMWEEFAAGCLANTEFTALFGGPPDGGDFQRDAALKVIEKIWTSIEASGRYAFGHAHATGYAMTGYWEIWPKHHYAAEFVMGLLVSDPANTPEYIREARRMGLAVLPPDVNLSGQKFTITDDSIRYGLDALRGIAAASARDIVAGRPYRSLQDYLATAGKGANKTVIVNLIKVGALDSLGDRAELLRQYEYHMVTRDLAESTRTNPEKLAAIVERRLAMPGSHIEIPDFTDPAVIYGIEQELCGRHITVDPLESYLSLLEGEVIYDPADIDDADTGARLTIAGQVTKVTRHAIKSGFQAGQEMAFVTVRFAESDFEFTAFPREWTQVKGMISLGAPVACECRKDGRGARLVELVRLDNLASKRKV